ncbi:MAG: PPC domain-containing protein [Hyphomonadaceae bacterium]
MRGKFFVGAASAALLALGFVAPAVAQTDDQPGDASTTARVSVGDAVTGALDPAGDRDWYRLRVEANTGYRITLDSADDAQSLDPMLVIYGADGGEIMRNDDAEGSFNSVVTYRSNSSGEVFVEARGFLDEAVGPYRLAVQASTLPPDDAGNDASSQARISAGRAVHGSIEGEGDEDWYRFSARTGQIYRISLNTAESNGLGDPLLRLIDADGNEIGGNDDSNGTLNSYFEFVPARSGEIFVVASGFGGATGAYALNIQADRLPPDDAGNDVSTRNRIRPGDSVSGALDYPNDRDWYRLTLGENEGVRIRLNKADDTLDPLLRVYDAQGVEIAVDDDGGGDLNSYLEFVSPRAGDYFVEAQGFVPDAVGAYTLSIGAGEVPADTSTDATLNAGGDYREGMLSPIGDKDWFRIDLEAGQSFRLGMNSMEGNDSLSDPYLVLYGPDGAELARDDDSGEGLNAWLEYTATQAGAHYVEARAFGQEGGFGRYALMLAPGEIGASQDAADYIQANTEPRNSQIGAPGDEDWFMVEMVEGRPYRINAMSLDGVFDPIVRLLDANGAELATDDDGGPGVNAYLPYLPVAGGAHYVAVSGFGDSTGQYTLMVWDTDVPGNLGTDEYLDASVGEDRGGIIEIAGDVDNFRVDLDAGRVYEVTLSGEGESALRNGELSVLNSSGEVLASRRGRTARVTFTPEATDSYLLQAKARDSSTGGYRITITPESTNAAE